MTETIAIQKCIRGGPGVILRLGDAASDEKMIIDEPAPSHIVEIDSEGDVFFITKGSKGAC